MSENEIKKTFIPAKESESESENKNELIDKDDAVKVENEDNSTANALSMNFKPEFDKSKSMYENSLDAIKTMSAGKASADERFIDDVAKTVKEMIKDDVTADKKIGKTKKQTESLESQNKKAEQFYNSYKPVFEFTGLKSACGIILMKIILAVMLVPFLIIKLISGFFQIVAEFFDGLNKIFESVTGFNKPLKNLLAIVFYGTMIVIALLVIISGIEYLFGLKLLPYQFN